MVRKCCARPAATIRPQFSCFRPGIARSKRSRRSILAPTTTSKNPSQSANCWHGFARRCAIATAARSSTSLWKLDARLKCPLSRLRERAGVRGASPINTAAGPSAQDECEAFVRGRFAPPRGERHVRRSPASGRRGSRSPDAHRLEFPISCSSSIRPVGPSTPLS